MPSAVRNLNSRDLLKSFALLTMLVGHFGQYFDWENGWWVAVARPSAPIWFFLAGYIRKGKFDWILLPAIAVLIVTRVLAEIPVLPLMSLTSIFLIRGLLRFDFKTGRPLLTVAVGLVAATLLYPSTSKYIEYGSFGVFLAYLGFLKRHESLDVSPIPMTAICTAVYIYLMSKTFDLAAVQLVVGGILSLPIVYWIFTFRDYEIVLKEGSAIRPAVRFLTPALKFMGRNTLLIYVVHLILFSWIGYGMWNR